MKKSKWMTALYAVDKMKWAKIYCDFNRWKFPEELKSIQPNWWTDDKINDEKTLVSIPIMNHIESVLGDRWVSREWNKDRMTEDEHNEWWIKNKIE